MDAVVVSMIGAPLATFTSTLLRGFQNKAVAANNKREAFIVGATMNAADILVIASVAAHSSIAVVALAALGAGTGWVTGMHIHDKLNRKKREALKAKKREKLQRRILKVVREVQQGVSDD
jgi:presenilin-like A22 family membrane protease